MHNIHSRRMRTSELGCDELANVLLVQIYNPIAASDMSRNYSTNDIQPFSRKTNQSRKFPQDIISDSIHVTLSLDCSERNL